MREHSGAHVFLAKSSCITFPETIPPISSTASSALDQSPAEAVRGHTNGLAGVGSRCVAGNDGTPPPGVPCASAFPSVS